MSRPINNAFVKVAVGIIVSHDAEVLVALRPAHNPLGGLWEFPGGKFEAGESTFDALKRELSEEIGVEVLKAQPLLCTQHTYDTCSVELNTWHITNYEGTPYGREGQTIQWVKADQLSQLNFPEGNKTIVQKVLENIHLLAEKVMPFEHVIPNKKTIVAMKESHHSKLASFKNIKALMADLHKED